MEKEEEVCPGKVNPTGVGGELMLTIYVWLPREIKFRPKKFKSNYGHAALLVPWCPGAPADEPHPLYISLYYIFLTDRRVSNINFAHQGEGKDGGGDRKHWNQNKYRIHRIRIPCTPAQAVSLWQAIPAMKHPDVEDVPNFKLKKFDIRSYYIPYTNPTKKIYSFDFGFTSHHEQSGSEHNCTTFILALLKKAEVIDPPHYWGSPVSRGLLTGSTKALNAFTVGYNTFVGTEVHMASLPKSILGGVIVSWVLMGLGILAQFVLPRSRWRSPYHPVAKTVRKITNLPLNMAISLLVLVISLGIFGYIVFVHAGYHSLFEGILSSLPLGMALGLGVPLGLATIIDTIRLETPQSVSTPEVLLTLFSDRVEDNFTPPSDLCVKLEEKGNIKQTDETEWRNYQSFFSKKSKKVEEESEIIELDSYNTVDEDSRDGLLGKRHKI